MRVTRPTPSWRFTAADYRQALAAGGETPPLRSRPVEASWDADLAGALAEGGVAVEEETMLPDLLKDLGL